MLKNNKKIDIFATNIRRVFSCYKFSIFELISVKSRFFDKLLINIREPYFKNEIEIAKITSKDRVLHIGCGINPTHCILIARHTQAKVVGIDNSSKAVSLARKYIKKNGFHESIKIELADGKQYNVKNFDVIFVAINVFPIDSVLKNLSRQLKKGTRVLCKSIKSDIPEVVKKHGFSNDFQIVDMVKNPKTQYYLLIKK